MEQNQTTKQTIETNQTIHFSIEGSEQAFVLKEISFFETEEMFRECRIVVEVGCERFDFLEHNQAFHLIPSAAGKPDGFEFAPDSPISIDLRANNELVWKLMCEVAHAEEACTLFEQRTLAELFDHNNWYALYLYQNESDSTGYMTAWSQINSYYNKPLPNTALSAQFKVYLETAELDYEEIDAGVFKIEHAGHNGEWSSFLQCFDAEKQAFFYSVLQTTVPQEQIPEALLLCSQLNYSYIMGRFELNVQDGEVRFATFKELSDNELTKDTTQTLIGTNWATMDQFLPLWERIVEGENAMAVLSEMME